MDVSAKKQCNVRDDVLKFLYSFFAPASPARLCAESFLDCVGANLLRNRNRTIRITGTNGKSATALLIEKRLLSAGQHTITLTSPHLLSIRERIRIDGVPISWTRLSDLLRKLEPHFRTMQRQGHHPSPIIVLTLVAIYLLAEGEADVIGVLEVGKGGGSDAINVFDRGIVALTSIGEDHLEEFGGTLQSLITEKLGLCRSGQPLVCGPLDEDTWKSVEMYCSRSNTRLHERLSLPLDSEGLPDYERANKELANICVRLLGFDGSAAWGDSLCDHDRRQFRTIARTTFVLDGAHNVPAWGVLIGNLARRPPCPRAAIVGIQKTKDWKAMLTSFCRADVVSCLLMVETTIGDPVPTDELCEFAASRGIASVAARGVASAVKQVLDGPWDECVVTGSFRLFRDFELALHQLGHGGFAAAPESIDPPQPWMRALL